MNGFKKLYDELISDKKRELFYTVSRKEEKAVYAQDFSEVTDRITANLSTLKRDDNNYIALCMKNSYCYFATVFAVLRAGFNILLVDYRASIENLSEFVRNINVRYVISDVIKENTVVDAEVLRPENLMSETDVSEITENWSNQLAFSTSGTIGKSKIVIYNDEKMYLQISRCTAYYKNDDCFMNMLKQAPNEPLRTLFALPMNHIFGFIKPLVLSYYGFSMVMPDNLALTTVMRACTAGHVSLMAGVPMMWTAIHNIILSRFGQVTHEAVTSLLGEYISIMMSGGAHTDIKLRKSFFNAGVYFVVGYGLTETGVIAYMVPHRGDITSEGLCYDWYECAVKTENNEILENGQGELLIKSDILMDGYYSGGKFNKIELTDGYYNTEDIFRIENRQIFFIGRTKNVIVNDSGENIYIEELESHFSDIFGKAGIFFGIIDRNDQPCLVAEIPQGDIPEQILEAVHGRVKELAVYKRPAEMIITSATLPRTTKGELKRNLVNNEFLEKHSDKVYNFKATAKK